MAFSPSRLHMLHSPFNGLTSFQIAIINFSNLQPLFPAAFFAAENTWQEKYTADNPLSPPQRSNALSILLSVFMFERWMVILWDNLQNRLYKMSTARFYTYLLHSVMIILHPSMSHLASISAAFKFSVCWEGVITTTELLLLLLYHKETTSMSHLFGRRCTS